MDAGKHGTLHAFSREKHTVRQNDICKAFFECVFKKATIVAMRDTRTVPLDPSFHFLLNT